MQIRSELYIAHISNPLLNMGTSSNKTDYIKVDAFKKQIRHQLEAEYGKFENLTSERILLIQTIHSRYFQQFTNDNNRIWTNASLFIPLSLGGLLTLKDSSMMHAAILGLGSTALMLIWVLLAEIQRIFQWRSQLIVDAIESYLKFEVPEENFLIPASMRLPFASGTLLNTRKIRWIMFGAITIVWMLAVMSKS